MENKHKILVLIFDKDPKDDVLGIGGFTDDDLIIMKEESSFHKADSELNIEVKCDIFYVKHKIEKLVEAFIDTHSKKIKDGFENHLPNDLIAQYPQIVIAGHWGDSNSKEDYKNLVTPLNEKNEKYKLSYYGSRLDNYKKDQDEITPKIIREILEIADVYAPQQATEINYFYTTQANALQKYSEKLENKENKTKKEQEELISIKDFLEKSDELKKLYDKIIANNKPTNT